MARRFRQDPPLRVDFLCTLSHVEASTLGLCVRRKRAFGASCSSIAFPSLHVVLVLIPSKLGNCRSCKLVTTVRDDVSSSFWQLGSQSLDDGPSLHSSYASSGDPFEHWQQLVLHL